MQSYFESVREFHEAYGLQVANKLQPIQHQDSLWLLRHNLHAEEYEEVRMAMENCDIVELADGIADLIYVLCGTAVSYGIPLDKVFAEVQRSNMSKLVPCGDCAGRGFLYCGNVPNQSNVEEECETCEGRGGIPLVRGDGKILKGPNFTPPNIAGVLGVEQNG